MYKLCLLVARLAGIGDGRRLKGILDQYSSSKDMEGQKIMKQLNLSAGSRSHGQAKNSGSGQLVENMATPRKVIPILLTFSSLALVFAGAEPGVVSKDQSYMEEVLPPFWGPTVHVVVGVGWEGQDLPKGDMPFFKDFRKAHPEVPLTHFLNAAYFVEAKVRSIRELSAYQAFSSIDEYALSINALKSLVELAGVQYRSEPNILQTPEAVERSLEEEKASRELITDPSKWENASPLEKDVALSRIEFENYLRRNVGFDIDIRAYSVAELQAIISKSKVILENLGLKIGKSFRVEGWLAGANVLEAFRRQGFRVNSSAVGFDQMVDKLPSPQKESWMAAPLTAMLRDLWPTITNKSQPFLLETPVGIVLEMPDTLASTDWASVKDMVDHIDSAVQQLDSEDRFAHIGFPLQSAAASGPRIIAAITEIKRKHGHRVVFETLQMSARRARSTQRLIELESQIKPHVVQSS